MTLTNTTYYDFKNGVVAVTVNNPSEYNKTGSYIIQVNNHKTEKVETFFFKTEREMQNELVNPTIEGLELALKIAYVTKEFPNYFKADMESGLDHDDLDHRGLAYLLNRRWTYFQQIDSHEGTQAWYYERGELAGEYQDDENNVDMVTANYERWYKNITKKINKLNRKYKR